MSGMPDIDRAVTQASNQRYKQLTRQELMRALVHPFDRFDVNASKFVQNDGREKVLVKLEGILPVDYRGVQYNIPIMMWLSDDFPYEAPICFVRPVQNMVLSDRCNAIDRNGRIINLNTLHHWSHDKTTLTDVFHDMAVQFGLNPPVFSRVVEPAAAIGFYPPMEVGPNSQTRQDAFSPGRGQAVKASIPEHVLQNSLISAVLDKARRKFVSQIHEQKSEISILKKTELDMLEGGRRIRELMQSLSLEEQRLNGYILTVREKYAELEHAIQCMQKQQRQESSAHDESTDLVTKLFVPSTQLHVQIVRLYTEDAAIQDALFYLGEGQRRRTISLGDYLRFTRELARKQFFLRATLLKARRVVGI